MRVRAEADVTGWGLVCPLGEDPASVAAAVDGGASALQESDDLRYLAGARQARLEGIPLQPWLKRRKDAKLMARPSQLLLPAAGRALADWGGDRDAVGLYFGVGQEPPDDGESEASLVASARDGRLDPERLAGPGRDLYPPLLPLRTLPNMALAHVSIHLDLGGPNGAWAGEAEAGFHALRAALHALGEGRCPVALAGATDSHADPGNARDLRRRGIAEHPGEAAAVLRLEPVGAATARCRLQLVEVEDPGEAALLEPARRAARAHRAALGRCGAGDGALAVVLACGRAASGAASQLLAVGEPVVLLRVQALATAAP